uniref:Agouti-related protein n=1 Tax=Ornithorhynchus anatinus TaxID=9258 RepID=F7DQS7_ORNAN
MRAEDRWSTPVGSGFLLGFTIPTSGGVCWGVRQVILGKMPRGTYWISEGNAGPFLLWYSPTSFLRKGVRGWQNVCLGHMKLLRSFPLQVPDLQGREERSPRRCVRLLESCLGHQLPCCDPCATCYCRFFNAFCYCRKISATYPCSRN